MGGGETGGDAEGWKRVDGRRVGAFCPDLERRRESMGDQLGSAEGVLGAATDSLAADR
jgi:hypothetical protein